MNSVEQAIRDKAMALPADRKIGFHIQEGIDAGHAFVLSKKSRVTFGRDGADVDLQDPAVSKLHCAVEVYGDLVVLRDLNSASGTFLNGFQVKDELLKNKDSIRLGGTILQVHIKMNE
ncbi:MAG: FHA domain-containing protein [Nitrospirae bacterium]|nr:FHA domain-containing protein [Nitrospirota bacterium]